MRGVDKSDQRMGHYNLVDSQRDGYLPIWLSECLDSVVLCASSCISEE